MALRLGMGLRGMAGFSRFEEMMSLRPDIVDAPDALPAPSFRGAIEFRHVSFADVIAGLVVLWHCPYPTGLFSRGPQSAGLGRRPAVPVYSGVT